MIAPLQTMSVLRTFRTLFLVWTDSEEGKEQCQSRSLVVPRMADLPVALVGRPSGCTGWPLLSFEKGSDTHRRSGNVEHVTS